MFDLDLAIPGSAPAVLDRAQAAREAELAAAADLLVAAAEWAELHACPTGGEEEVVALAGDGAPLVAEFAPLTFAARLGTGPDTGRRLVGDALELKHRLPRLWQRVTVDHDLPAWRARTVAGESSRLTRDQATKLDRWLCRERADRLTLPRVRAVVDEIVLYDDPDRAGDDERRADESRFVRLDHHSHPAASVSTADLTARLDTTDALALEAAVSEVACALGELGDTDTWEVRQARALGVLADPHRAIALVAKVDTDPRPAITGEITLVVHLDAAADRGDGVAHLEGRGPITAPRLDEWIARCGRGGARVTVRPVLDLTDRATLARAVDRHDPPAWMREAAVLRDDTCCFPGCPRDSRRADLDHIEPYVPPGDGGPPGQTNLDNLAPLCRSHHRLKTHGGWRYQRLAEHHFVWTSPDGRVILTTTHRRRR